MVHSNESNNLTTERLMNFVLGVIDSLVESTSSMHGIKKYRSIRGPANTGSDEDYDFDY